MPELNPNLMVKIDGREIDVSDVFEIEVQLDLNEPDMCAVVVGNVGASRSSTLAQGAPVEITADDSPIFKGELTGLEPIWDYGLPSRCTVRALNKLHRLSRGRRSRTFEKMTDQDIVTKICQDAGLQAQCDATVKIKHDHVYQHNQTNLQFIRQRAARIDYEVVVEDTKLLFRKRQTDKDSGIKLSFGDGTLERFRPRMSGAVQVNKVVCRGWNPVQRKEIIGTAQADSSLGSTAGPSAFSANQSGQTETVETDRPIYSQEEADAIARALLKEKQMQFIQGEAMTHGIPALKPGLTVQIEVEDPRFDGKYYVDSVRHRFVHSVGGAGGVAHREAGFRTFIHVLRDSQGDGAAARNANPAAQSQSGNSQNTQNAAQGPMQNQSGSEPPPPEPPEPNGAAHGTPDPGQAGGPPAPGPVPVKVQNADPGAG